MSEDIVIISPELSSGGIGDYTRRLLKHLPSPPGLRVIVPKSNEALVSGLPARGGKVLLQYSGYGYQRFGYPRWLIHALLDWKKKSHGFLAIMFHETWTAWPLWNKNYLIQQLHRRDIGKLLRVADKVFTSTSRYAAELAALSSRNDIQVLPVGSNIAVACETNGERQTGLAVLFGLQIPRLRALRKMEAELKALSANKKITRIIAIGPGNGREEEERLHGLNLSDGFEQTGPLEKNAISKLLSTAAFAIWAQGEFSVTKSGTLMACAAHRLNIVSCYADAEKPEPLSLLVAPRELLRGITKMELRGRGARLRAWQERTAAWPHIASEVARALHLEISAS